MSASRLGTISRCGLAFEYRYIKGLPAPWDRARTLFGHAVHDGLQLWYGYDDEPADHQAHDLAPLVLAQWERLLPPKIWADLQVLRDMDEECEAVAAAILFKRPMLKAPTQTQEYLTCEAVKEFVAKRAELVAVCDKFEEIKWSKDEDPYKAYKLSAKLADQMQARWQHLPRPLAVERPFALEIEGFRVRGRLDQLRLDPAWGTGEAVPRLVDVKTIASPMTQMEAFLQSFLYVEAVCAAPDLPDTNEVAFYLARHNKYQQGKVVRERHRKVAKRILNGRARAIATGAFEPSYGHWCKLCDYSDICSTELSLWDGDGLVVELLDPVT